MNMGIVISLASLLVAAGSLAWGVLEHGKRTRLERKLALHPERKAIYESVQGLIANIVASTQVDYDTLGEFNREVRHARLYFPQAVQSFLEELYARGLELVQINRKYSERVGTATEKELSAIVKEQHECLQWFEDSFRRAESVFDPHVKLTE